MAKKFVRVSGMHNVFPVSNGKLNTSSLLPGVASNADTNSTLYITVDATDVNTYGYRTGETYIWTHGELYDCNEQIIADPVSSVSDVNLTVYPNIPTVDKTSDTSSSFGILPNKLYLFGTRTNLTITFGTPTSGIVNEYMFRFTSGSTATTLNVPSTVKWETTPNITANKVYLVDIIDNLGVIRAWSN